MQWSAGQCQPGHSVVLRYVCPQTHDQVGKTVYLAIYSDLSPEIPVVTLATAHPAKFRDAVERATGQRPMLPRRVSGLFEREERYETLPGELQAVEAYIAERATES